MLGGGFLLALLIAFLVPFPGTLFNKTVEANYDEIRGWFAPFIRRTKPIDAALGKLSGPAAVGIFTALSALVYGFLSPGFGLNASSAGTFLGILVGLLFITLAFDLPIRFYHRRRTGDGGRLGVLWWTLAVAVICVLISRLVGFQPGYLYGLIVSILFTTVVTARDEGIGVWLASLWLLGLSVVAWLLLGWARHAGGDPWLALVLQTTLATFVVAGIETMVIGLMPMRFMPGRALYEWRRVAWFPLFVAAIFAYIIILIDPHNGYLSDDSRTPMLIGVIFLVGFGIVSVGTWAYFRFRPARRGSGGADTPDRPVEASEPAT